MPETEPNNTIDYKKLFHSAPGLFLLIKPNAPDFTIIDSSDLHLAATLTKREEIINKNLFDVFPDNPNNTEEKSSYSLRQSLQNVLEKKQQHVMPVLKYDIPVPAENGGGYEERYWTPVNTPVFNDKKEIIYIINQVEDVTKTILLEKEKEREASVAKALIEEKVVLIKKNEERINLILNALLKYTTMDFSERLAITEKGDELDAIAVGLNSVIDELENQMTLLIDSNTELEYANKELDSFSYSVSHDLRAPLRAINGYSQMLVEDYGDKLDEEGKHTISVIVKNAFKMGTLIDDLLTFSRVGKQNLTKVILNMDNIVDSIARESKDDNKKIEINIKPLGTIEGDGSMVKQVITNLLSNAIKYSGKKEKTLIEIGSYKENNTMVFYVKDNGAGFNMKYYDKLFGVFQRLHSANEFEGTGVGLALVQRIIKKHNGHVWADSIPGEGATFYFSLPVTSNN